MFQRMFRPIFGAARPTAIFLGAFALHLAVADAKCSGSDMLPRLQKSHPEIMADVRRKAALIPNTEAIFWRVSKPGTAASHLFGTMHVSDKRIVTMPPAASEALNGAKIVALEIKGITPEASMQAIAQMPGLMIYKDGSSLSQKLSAPEYEKIETLLGNSNLPREMLAVLRPWMVSIFMAVPECEQLRTQAGNLTLDSQIEKTATDGNIAVVGLETIGSQLKAMAAVPDADQLAILRVSLAFMADREDLFETLIQAYLGRELGVALALTDGMARIAGIKESGFAAFSLQLIERRNQTMFDTSLPIVDSGNAFIAVGAAHLVGANGLVALYRQAGFTVTAVK